MNLTISSLSCRHTCVDYWALEGSLNALLHYHVCAHASNMIGLSSYLFACSKHDRIVFLLYSKLN